MSAVAMKDSGVEWLGEVPRHWELLRFDAVLAERNEKNTDLISNNVLSLMKDVGVIRYVDKGNIGNRDSDRPENYKLVYPNDLVLNSMNLFIGSVGISRELGVTSSVYIVCYPRQDCVDIEYYHSVIRDRGFQSYMGSLGDGIMEIRRAVKYKDLKAQYLPLPPLAEQRAIAAYLDRQTARIDALIVKTQQLNALLREKRVALISQAVTRGLDPAAPLKASGVEWLGEIPAHWDVKRLKHMAVVRTSNVDKKSVDTEDMVSLLNYTDVYYNEYATDDIDFMQATATKHQIKLFQLQMGDVIVTKDSETWDDIAVPVCVAQELPGVVCGYHLALIRPDEQQSYGRYISRVFASVPGAYQFKVGANGITRFGLTQKSLRDAEFPLPPLAEQRAIAAYLDRQTAKIDALIAKNDQLIALLREKRTSLISAAVTGKIDLRNT